jgi:uncharacterized membrane protein
VRDVGFIQKIRLRRVVLLDFQSRMLLDHRRTAFNFAALSFLSIGVLQLYSKEILIGRPPFALVGGSYHTFLAWTVGVLLIISAAIAIMRQRLAIVSAITAAFVIAYCVLPNLWLVVNGDTGIGLTGFGKGISLAAGLLVLTASAPSQWETRRSKVIMRISNYAFGFFLLASGIQHFLFAPFVVTLIPSWIPFAEFWTYAAGVFLALSGLSLMTGFKRAVALRLSALMIFLWVLIIHIPRAFFTVPNVNEWAALCEACAFASLLFILSRAAIIGEKLAAPTFFQRETSDI